jgi:hypothetical protein
MDMTCRAHDREEQYMYNISEKAIRKENFRKV